MQGEWTSMAIYSKGEYGAPKDVYFGFPVKIRKPRGDTEVVEGLAFEDWSDLNFVRTSHDLAASRDIIQKFCDCPEIIE